MTYEEMRLTNSDAWKYEIWLSREFGFQSKIEKGKQLFQRLDLGLGTLVPCTCHLVPLNIFSEGQIRRILLGTSFGIISCLSE